MSGCSKHRKGSCILENECSWIIGKGCKPKPKTKSPIHTTSPQKSPSNSALPKKKKNTPTRKMVETMIKKAHRKNRKSTLILSKENTGILLKKLLKKSGAVLFTRAVANKYIGNELVLLSDYDFELNLPSHAKHDLSSLSSLVKDSLSSVKVIEVTDDEVYYFDGNYGPSFANLPKNNVHKEDKVRRNRNDVMWVWTKKDDNIPATIESPSKEKIKLSLPKVVTTPSSIKKTIKKENKLHVDSTVELSSNNYGFLNGFLQKIGAVPFTRGVAKSNIGKELVMFSDYDFRLESHKDKTLSSLGELVTNMLSHITITEVTHDEVYYYDRDYGARFHGSQQKPSDKEEISRKGYDIIWVWPKH